MVPAYQDRLVISTVNKFVLLESSCALICGAAARDVETRVGGEACYVNKYMLASRHRS